MTSTIRPVRSATISVIILLAIMCNAALASDGEPATTTTAPTLRPNMAGAYGPWLSDKVLTDGPAQLPFRTNKWKSLDQWRRTARARVWERMAPVDLGGQPDVRVEAMYEFDGLHIERLSWQLPVGPRTEAVFLKPADAEGRLPGILALHDHGGNKFLNSSTR